MQDNECEVETAVMPSGWTDQFEWSGRREIDRVVLYRRKIWFTQTRFCALPDGPGVGKNGDGVRPVKKWNAYSCCVEGNRQSTLDITSVLALTRTKIGFPYHYHH